MFEKIAKKIKKELLSCKRPLFFFHDDQDGLASFLLLYRFIREGKGVIVKSRPLIDMKFLRKVQEYEPDKIFVLDIASMDQDFIDAAKVPIVWVDHHDLVNRDKVKYFNPKQVKKGDTTPVTYLCYKAVEQDDWIAMVGCIGDWFLPDFFKKFSSENPDLLPKGVTDAEDALFDTDLGRLSRMLGFVLKGKTSDAMKCVKILTRISDPREILEQSTPAGKFIYKRFEKVNQKYEKLLGEALTQSKKTDKMIVFAYKEAQISFTGVLANELLHRYPNKLVYVAREKEGEMRGSLRSKNIDLTKLIPKALEGVEGYGGGHPNTCGATVKAGDFTKFVENLKKEV